ncbi:MAG TPA: flagellar basal-body rod protein FlgF [Steroidobacteraceae bacterium]|nr:flagellar basal-body rod protein FlgF [Steroidobacteraceae bacterium]
MDKSLYVAMTGAKGILDAQAVNNFNLANASTTGFKADLAAFQSQAVVGSGYASRVYATDSTTGWDQSQGALLTTGQSLDVALQGPGYIAVQGPNGQEAYTRNGDLHLTSTGLLVTSTGQPVLGDNGPITLPPSSSIKIGDDGTITVLPFGAPAQSLATVGRIKLVNPPADTLVRASGGLFQLAAGGSATAPADASVKLASGVLESSNVDLASAMVNMIDLSRNFDLQVKAMKSADDNAQASSQLLQST